MGASRLSCLAISWLTLILAAIQVTEGLAVPKPPSGEKPATTARYLLHTADWISVSTISTQPAIRGLPFVTPKSHSDGPKHNSTGTPYFYLTDMDYTGADIAVNNSVTIMISQAELNACDPQTLDPQDPRCARVMITGKMLKLEKDSEEYEFGLNSLFEKHPQMKYWPANHGFYVAKVVPEQILVLNHFGGVKNVPVSDYFNEKLEDKNNLSSTLPTVSS